METADFQKGVKRLLDLAIGTQGADPKVFGAESKDDGREAVNPLRTAIMCAESVWWRCHRSLIADYLKSSEVEVLHILGANKVEPHPYTPAARIVEGKLSYEV
jgi:uncharacterized protein (DUF488 family)